VYIATLIGVQVYSPQGKLLGVIRVPEVPSGVAFGGRDFSTLYVTARTSVYAFPMLVKGVHAAKS
jgi:gluconolactonase